MQQLERLVPLSVSVLRTEQPVQPVSLTEFEGCFVGHSAAYSVERFGESLQVHFEGCLAALAVAALAVAARAVAAPNLALEVGHLATVPLPSQTDFL